MKRLVILLTAVTGSLIALMWLTVVLPAQIATVPTPPATASPDASRIDLPSFPAVLSWIDQQKTLLASPSPVVPPAPEVSSSPSSSPSVVLGTHDEADTQPVETTQAPEPSPTPPSQPVQVSE